MSQITYEYQYYNPGKWTSDDSINRQLNEYGELGFKIINIRHSGENKDELVIVLMKTVFPPNTPIELQAHVLGERRLDPQL